jgi:hypothetical protein
MVAQRAGQGFSAQCCRSLPVFSKTKAAEIDRRSRMLSRERGLRMRLRVRVSIARALFLYRKTSKRRCMKLKFLPASAFNNYHLRVGIATLRLFAFFLLSRLRSGDASFMQLRRLLTLASLMSRNALKPRRASIPGGRRGCPTSCRATTLLRPFVQRVRAVFVSIHCASTRLFAALV